MFDASTNTPLQEASVYIVPADRKMLPETSDLYRESQGKEGHFQFVHIPPGEYLIVVNPGCPGPGIREDRDRSQWRTGERCGYSRRAEVGTPIVDHLSIEAKGTVHADALADVQQPDSKAAVIQLARTARGPARR